MTILDAEILPQSILINLELLESRLIRRQLLNVRLELGVELVDLLEVLLVRLLN